MTAPRPGQSQTGPTPDAAEIGLAAIAPGPNTSRPHLEHKVYPYLLRVVPVLGPGQFTSAAFTDVLKRESVVISMDSRDQALDNIFVERLWPSVKHENVYLKGYASMVGLKEYFVFYYGERPHQFLANKTPDAAYRSAVGGGAMIVDIARGHVEFGGAVEAPPVPQRSTVDSSTAEEAKAPTRSKTKRRSTECEVKCASLRLLFLACPIIHTTCLLWYCDHYH